MYVAEEGRVKTRRRALAIIIYIYNCRHYSLAPALSSLSFGLSTKGAVSLGLPLKEVHGLL